MEGFFSRDGGKEGNVFFSLKKKEAKKTLSVCT
jgi:hypothetical protein